MSAFLNITIEIYDNLFMLLIINAHDFLAIFFTPFHQALKPRMLLNAADSEHVEVNLFDSFVDILICDDFVDNPQRPDEPLSLFRLIENVCLGLILEDEVPILHGDYQTIAKRPGSFEKI